MLSARRKQKVVFCFYHLKFNLAKENDLMVHKLVIRKTIFTYEIVPIRYIHGKVSPSKSKYGIWIKKMRSSSMHCLYQGKLRIYYPWYQQSIHKLIPQICFFVGLEHFSNSLQVKNPWEAWWQWTRRASWSKVSCHPLHMKTETRNYFRGASKVHTQKQ